MMLESELARGTTVRKFLTRHYLVSVNTQTIFAPPNLEDLGSGEVVLFDKDGEFVGAMATEQLRELGYCVLDAEDGAPSCECRFPWRPLLPQLWRYV